MAALTHSAPVLLVRDVAATVAHYRTVLGFGRERLYGEPPTFAIMARDRMHVMFRRAEDPAPHDAVMPGLWDVYFWTDDADGLFAELQANGAAIIYEPRDQDYGSRECVVRDPDGHHIAFGQDL